MISVVLCFRDRSDRRFFEDLITKEIRLLTRESYCIRDGALQAASDEGPYPDLIIHELARDEDISKVIRLRQSFPETEVFIAADSGMTATDYVIPDIRPSGLAIRPFMEARAVLRKLLIEILKKRMGSGRYMVVRTGNTDHFVPYQAILYIQADNGLLFLHCERMTISFYGFLHELDNELPQTFFRCHRSFIVHTISVEKMNMAPPVLTLKNGRTVPVSRRLGRRLRSHMIAMGREDNREKKEHMP